MTVRLPAGLALKRMLWVALVVIPAAYYAFFLSDRKAAHAQNETQSNAYSEMSPSSGVWAGGQAAFWDFNIFDHFRLFGAGERAKGYAPTQPIQFSHVIHVQQHKIECQFCHWNVAKGAYAALPEVETCMGCHKMITFQDGVDAQGHPKAKAGREWEFGEVQKLKNYFDSKQPIPWEKVHVMPDHVRFNHKRHVKSGVGCQECHGQVPVMPVVARQSSMKMGWCIDCHRDHGTSIDCITCHK